MSIGMFDNEQPRQRRNDEIRMPKDEGNQKHETRIAGATRSYSRPLKAIQGYQFRSAAEIRRGVIKNITFPAHDRAARAARADVPSLFEIEMCSGFQLVL